MVPVSPRRPAAAHSSEVMSALPPGKASTYSIQASTFGSIEPGANWPCLMYSLASDTVMVSMFF